MNMNAPALVRLTEIFILAILAIVIIVDLVLASNEVKDDTISEVIRNWVYNRGWFVITWAWGVLAGHLFLTRQNPLFSHPNPIVVLLGLTAIILLVGLVNQTHVSLPIQLVLLILGIAAGYLLWPQAPITPKI